MMGLSSVSGASDPATGEFPPGPDGLPVLGNTAQFASDPHAFYEELASYGDVVGYEVARQRFCTLLHPDHVERVLLTDPGRFRKWQFEEFGPDFAPDGILFAEGEQWRRQRTVAQPAFTPDRIRSYADAMADLAAETAAGWDDGETIAADRAFSRLTLRILGRSLFDLDLDADGPVARGARAINERADASGIAAFLPTWVPTPANRRYRRALADFEAVVEELIDERRGDPTGHDDLLTLLLHAEEDGQSLSPVELRDSMVTFLFAGHETTSLALTYACYLLAEHPDARAKLDAELDAVLGGDRPTLADLPELTCTERVVEEALRLYPPAYVMFREAREDVEIGGYRIPEGTKLTLPQFKLHRDPRWWDDPDAFRPERFADEDPDRPDYAYFPFGGGPRHCIGMRFATMELQQVLATLCQRVDFEYVGDGAPEPRMAATYQPKDGVRLRVRKR